MGLFTIDDREIYELVREKFGETDNYLVAIKHNNLKKSIVKAIFSTLYRNIDSSREYILYFSENGIYEKEFGFSDNTNFVLIPWNEVEEFTEDRRAYKLVLNVNHLGKTYSYEIHFNGGIMKGNEERLVKLNENNYFRI